MGPLLTRGVRPNTEEQHLGSNEQDSNFETHVLENANDDSDTEHEGQLEQPENREPSGQRYKHQKVFQDWMARESDNLAIPENESLLASSNTNKSRLKSASRSEVARSYQQELYERASVKNIIAVLPTGAGKTLIASKLLKDICAAELKRLETGDRQRTAFFLVDRNFLAQQQYEYLEAILDESVIKCTGDDGTDFWSADTWKDIIKRHRIVVCTGEVLNQCLWHGFVRMEDINLLIFDEAHHTKKDHPYARIIKDHYLSQKDLNLRPRIFSMTASPVDAKADVVQTAQELETLLHSQIATSSDPSLTNHCPRPAEVEWIFGKLRYPFETELLQKISTECNCKTLRKSIAFAKMACVELGPRCADMVWDYKLDEEDWGGSEVQLRRRWRPKNTARFDGTWDEEMKKVERAEEIITTYRSKPRLAAEHDDLSSKVLVLRQELEEFYREHPETRCIVFVSQRATALILRDLFRETSISLLRPAAFLGCRVGAFGDGSNSATKQQAIIGAFDDGDINCLFATSVAEEGLDIQGCNLVVRFDLCTTMIQYLQSRGRARRPGSVFVNMIEAGNQCHRDLVTEVRDAEIVFQHFCNALPEDRILRGCDADIEELLAKDRSNQGFTIQSSGARLNYRSSLIVLENYASSLRHEGCLYPHVEYTPKFMTGSFQYMALLPEQSPFRGALGDPKTSKLLAKQSAAFHTCVKLYELGLLDDTFTSTTKKRRPLMASAKLAIRSEKKDEYDMQVKPEFWTMQTGSLPQQLYAMYISLKPQGTLRGKYADLLLLTRAPLPKFPDFPIYLEGDVETLVRTIPISSKLILSQDMATINLLTSFTIRLYEDLFNKKYEAENASMPYWIAPAMMDPPIDLSKLDAKEVIDFEMLQRVETTGSRKWEPGMDPHEWENRFLVDRWSGKFRYFSATIAEGFRPNSPLPWAMPTRKRQDSIISYCLSLYGGIRDKFLANMDHEQPVLKAKLLSLKRNLFEEMSEKEKAVTNHKYVVCPQVLELSALPVPIVASSFTFPTIISRIDSYLIALEACNLLGLDIGPELALEAVTKDSDNTEEHHAEQIHLRRGMGKNYERLEFIGDTFLKMATSISLFVKCPSDSEFDFHVSRMEMICNQNLFDGAMLESRSLAKFIRTEAFNRRTWYPEGVKLLSGKGIKITKDVNDQRDGTRGIYVKHGDVKHPLGKKTIADVCEAIIGAAFLTVREQKKPMDMAVKAVTKLVNSKNHDMETWREYSAQYQLPSYQLEKPSSLALNLQVFIETNLGYSFKYPRLLQSAFTHPSDPWAAVPNYQRLEFLGDALYDMACVEFLYNRHPDKDPQWLTEHKMAMVSNKFLAAVAVSLDFDRHLQFNTVALHEQINRYGKMVREVIKNGKENTNRDYWSQFEHPPKAISDMVEAYIGAIFVDSNFDYTVVERFFEKHIAWYFDDMTVYDTFANKHPTTFLHNCLTDKYGCMDYRLMANSVPGDTSDTVIAAVVIHEQVVASSSGSSGKYAKVRASEKALKVLEDLSLPSFREKYQCDCHLVRKHRDGKIQADSAI